MITIYSKPNCMQCEFAKKYLNEKGVEFKEINVFEDKESMQYLLNGGYAQLPVVDIGGEFHTGFQPNILAKVEV